MVLRVQTKRMAVRVHLKKCGLLAIAKLNYSARVVQFVSCECERAQYLQQPVDSDDECDVFCGESDSVEDHDHGDQTCLGDTGSTNTSHGSRDTGTHK